MSKPIVSNLDLHKLSAADFEHFDRTDGLSEEEEARAAEEVERQIDQWVEENEEDMLIPMEDGESFGWESELKREERLLHESQRRRA